MKIYWMQPGEINSVSGGYIYNKNIIEGIRSQSIQLELLIPGTDFPYPSKKSIEKCRAFFQSMESSSVVIVDSLIMGTVPNLIKEFTTKLTIAGMIHLPLSLSPSLSDDEKKNIKYNETESFSHSKMLIVTSEFTKSEIVKMGVDESKVHIVTPGINTGFSKRNYPEKPKNLLCVSRITVTKGQLDLIVALVNLQRFDWKLTLCGGFDEQDEYFKEIKSRISTSGLGSRVIFTGEIPQLEVENFYRQAELLILPSYFETYSMVLQEAMAFKIPVISTNSGATTKTAGSQVAKFYQPGDITHLEKLLLSVLDDSNEYRKLTSGYSKLNLKFLTWKDKTTRFLQILSNK